MAAPKSSDPVKFDPRMLMEMAVDVMRQTRLEQRPDGKPSPKVGAVLWFPDGSVVTASRGELRVGDHAEYTLLERKCVDRNLEEAILFATLEPCAPGSRNEPKRGCAERVVKCRIKKVWVGIVDSDPKVDRKGIKFLQDSGVAVEMFDRDLQDVIEAENKEFLEKAIERAMAARQEVEQVVLSSLEAPTSVPLSDFAPEAMLGFHDTAGIRESIDSTKFRDRLTAMGLTVLTEGAYRPTGFGNLLFGKEPRLTMPQAVVLATIHFQDGTEEIRDFDGPQVLVPEQVIHWLQDKLPNVIDRTDARRRGTLGSVLELVRESVVNALVHRDYAIDGAKIQLIVTPHSIVVKSPGGPVAPITLEQLQSFNAPMLSRNPILHRVFAQMELAEERGLGLKSIKAKSADLGLPLPTYHWGAPYLTLTIFLTPSGRMHAIEPGILASLNVDERQVLEYMTSQERSTSPGLSEHFDFEERKVQRILKKLLDAGLVLRSGSAKSTHYTVARP